MLAWLVDLVYRLFHAPGHGKGPWDQIICLRRHSDSPSLIQSENWTIATQVTLAARDARLHAIVAGDA